MLKIYNGSVIDKLLNAASAKNTTGVLEYRVWPYALPDVSEIGGVILPGNIFDSEFRL